jgi:hypothetical protein
MKYRNLILLGLLTLSLFTACGQQAKGDEDIKVAISAALTQTAAVAKPTAVAATPTPQNANGVIKGKVGIMAPPTPPMDVYAWDQSSNKWAVAQTTANPNGMADFSISIPAGNYMVFAFSQGTKGGASAAYSSPGGLTLVKLAAGQTVDNIMVQFPGQDECGISINLPPSPDGKYPTAEGRTRPARINSVKAANRPRPRELSTTTRPG